VPEINNRKKIRKTNLAQNQSAAIPMGEYLPLIKKRKNQTKNNQEPEETCSISCVTSLTDFGAIRPGGIGK